jgi:hypothetical protein
MKSLRSFFLFSVFLATVSAVHAQSGAQSFTKITGYAPQYVGQKIELFEIQDYLSMREALLATATVQPDSTFSFVFFNEKTRKIIVKSKKNKGFMYIQPHGDYQIYMPEKNQYDVYRPQGNDVEISFLDLPETDINYKILSLDKWINSFLGTYFYRKNINGTEFVTQLENFKENVAKAYGSDTADVFFQTYVRFSIASLDDIQFKGSRNRYEKFDFYLKNYPVSYDNDAYMNYVKAYYENLFPRLSMETNNRVYLGLLKSSPTLIMRALNDEYALKNVRLRELVLIQALSEVFYKDDYPQTNILSVLDSISKHSLFAANSQVATNLIFRLTELVPGSKAPDFLLKTADGQSRNLAFYTKKHLYIQFFDPTLKESVKEMELLKPLYQKYKAEFNIITVYEQNENLTKKQKELIAALPWESFALPADHSMLKSYQVESYPLYVLIDAYGYVVANPALRPTPNGQYETIDKSLFFIKKTNDAERNGDKN